MSHGTSSSRACAKSAGAGFRYAVKTRSGNRLRNSPGWSSVSMVARSVEASTAQTFEFASRIPDAVKASMLVSPKTMMK